MKHSIFLTVALISGLTLFGCATAKVDVQQAKTDNDIKSLVMYLGASSGDEDEKQTQESVIDYILARRAEAKPIVIDALVNGKGSLRYGATKVLWKWADADFIEPLFAALADASVSTRSMASDDFQKQIPELDEAAREKTALRLVACMEKEREAMVLAAYASSLAVFAVKATHEPLVALSDGYFETRTKKYNVHTIGEAIMFGANMKKAVEATAP